MKRQLKWYKGTWHSNSTTHHDFWSLETKHGWWCYENNDIDIEIGDDYDDYDNHDYDDDNSYDRGDDYYNHCNNVDNNDDIDDGDNADKDNWYVA